MAMTPNALGTPISSLNRSFYAPPDDEDPADISIRRATVLMSGIVAQTPQAQPTGRPHLGARHDRASYGGLFVRFDWRSIRWLITRCVRSTLLYPSNRVGYGS